MNIDTLIEKKFSKYGIFTHVGGDFLLKQADALRVIDECERLNAVILGLDFWKIYNEKGDVMEVNSTNWASINKGPEASKNTIEAARELIGHGLPDDANYVSFVLRDQEV